MQDSLEVHPGINPVLRNAVRLAMASGAVGAAAHVSDAIAQTPSDSSSGVEEVVVTGSRIPRAIDQATADTITTVDSTTITNSGVASTGDIIQQLPAISGAAMNTGTNNGGGFGESNIELRGLDAKRTLVLLDGRRISLIGNSGAVDVNQIPTAMIDHIDVLKEGAGAIYGSDAIAGVVNIVTRKSFDGIEVSDEYGQTTRNDGKHNTVSVLMGTSTDKANILVGGSFLKQKEVLTGARDFSSHARYLYSGTAGRSAYSVGGSSRNPYGRIYLKGTDGAALAAQYGCTSITRKPGTTGASQADYGCYTSADGYNYQAVNLLQTPIERGSLFTNDTYNVTDDLTAYAEVLYNKTHSGFQFAPLPIDATVDNLVIPANAAGNVFGIPFGGSDGANNEFLTRFVTLGFRQSDSDSASSQTTLGLKGKFGESAWEWDVNANYNRLDQSEYVNGYFITSELQGLLNAGTLNIFDLNDPASIAALKSISTSYTNTNAYVAKGATANVTGPLFALPAGEVELAAGFEYRDLSDTFTADYVTQATAASNYLECQISQEACVGSWAGSYNDREMYAEVLVPILKNLPGAQQLDFDYGVRRSDYSGFTASTKSQFKLEYKPVSDLLLRGTFSQVFRVPTLSDLHQAPQVTSQTYSADSYCENLTAAQQANPYISAACFGATNAATGQITGLITSNPDLKPETGYVYTFGAVLQVPGVENLSVSIDDWHYKVDNLIDQIYPNFAVQECTSTGQPEFCNLIHRFSSGSNLGVINYIEMPYVNLGGLRTDGADVGVKYALRNTAAGNFQFALDATYTNSYSIVAAPGIAPVEYAGTYNEQYGNYARWRGTLMTDWTMGPFEAYADARYIHHVVIHDPATQNSLVAGTPDPDLKIPPIIYLDLTLGYTVPVTKTKLQFGIENLNNRQPPIVYMNNTENSNTDVATYDLLGRRWFVSFKQTF